MLEKPLIQDSEVLCALSWAYEIAFKELFFLPIGADVNTAVFKVVAKDGADYFLKLRKKEFNSASTSVPKYLASRGIKQVIPPLCNKDGDLWIQIGSFKAILYPYVDGTNGAETKLSKGQWKEFGACMRQFHETSFPEAITKGIPQETFSSKWRDRVKVLLKRIQIRSFKEPISLKTSLFLKAKNEQILRLIQCAEDLAVRLQKRAPELTLCHGDIHPWNLFIDRENSLYIVDWDTLIFAPKERDLMFIKAGICDSGRPPQEEEDLFYEGYGDVEISRETICYYRCERIIQDIDAHSSLIFHADASEEDKMQSFNWLLLNFLPGGTMERAFEK